MSLLDEFEEWLVKEANYERKKAKMIVRREWMEGFLSWASDKDVEVVLYEITLFAFAKAFGKERGLDERFNWVFMYFSDMEYGFMEACILEMNTRTVVGYVSGDPNRVDPKGLEEILRDLIKQVSDAKNLLSLRLFANT